MEATITYIFNGERKEIRKTLRIREGDPLEIFTDKDGEVILKKYSPIGELSEFALQYAETLAKTSGHVACITDTDTVIAVSGASKREFLDKSISHELEKIMNDKTTWVVRNANEKRIPLFSNESPDKYYAQENDRLDEISPIIQDLSTRFYKEIYNSKYKSK